MKETYEVRKHDRDMLWPYAWCPETGRYTNEGGDGGTACCASSSKHIQEIDAGLSPGNVLILCGSEIDHDDWFCKDYRGQNNEQHSWMHGSMAKA